MAKLQASEIRYGVELETVCPQSLQFTIGGYHSPVQVSFLPEGWSASYDSSIQAPNGYRGCEIVSPILQGADGLRQIQEVCRILTEKGFRVNASTGVHVSVDWGRDTSSELLSRLISMVSYCEAGIFAITGTHSRELGHWCQSVSKYGNVDEAKKVIDVQYHGARYHVLNLTNLHNGQDRVEFRAFSGSLNAVKIIGWVQVCVGIVQKAKTAKKQTKWTAKENPACVERWHGNGVGKREVFRLQEFLNWYPYMIARGKDYGLIEDSPISRESIVREFTRLAVKYDAETR